MPRSRMPVELVQYWDERIRLDLDYRRSWLDDTWKLNREMVRNAEEGIRYGNLVADFVEALHVRLLRKDPIVLITADDPENDKFADNAKVVANAIVRLSGLLDALKGATAASTWASVGWMEVGHPMDPYSLDLMRSFRTPNVDRDIAGGVDSWRPASENEVAGYGVDPAEVLPFDPLAAAPRLEPQPMLVPDTGYPWVQAVDPRMIVTNFLADKVGDLDYLARLRFLTAPELQRLTGYKYEGGPAMYGSTGDLFTEITGLDRNYYPELLTIVDLWVKRDRNNPAYNNWQVTFPLGEPEKVISAGPNQWGGLLPYIPVHLKDLKILFDRTIAEELTKYADMFDVGVQAVMRNMQRMLNKKWAAGQHVGLDAKQEKNLLNDSWQGILKVNDPNGIKLLVEERFDRDLVAALAFIKSLAQQNAGSSDLDRGMAIQNITARQTQALLDATGINIEGMAAEVNKAAGEAVVKLMHLVGVYSTQGRSRRFVFGRQFATIDRGTHDFTTSYLYDVRVVDNGPQATNEERLVWLQFLKLLGSPIGQVLLPHLDVGGLVFRTLQRFGEGPDLLARGLPSQAPSGDSAGLPGLPANFQNLLDGGAGAGVEDGLYGQHPERESGSRGGVDMANALTGLLKLGTGMGEG